MAWGCCRISEGAAETQHRSHGVTSYDRYTKTKRWSLNKTRISSNATACGFGLTCRAFSKLLEALFRVASIHTWLTPNLHMNVNSDGRWAVSMGVWTRLRCCGWKMPRTKRHCCRVCRLWMDEETGMGAPLSEVTPATQTETLELRMSYWSTRVYSVHVALFLPSHAFNM